MSNSKETSGHEPSTLFSISERTIIVTGALGGLGLSVTEILLRSGADVIATDHLEKAEGAAWDDLRTFAQQYGTVLTYCASDITSSESTESVLRQAASQSRYPLRGLVNTAGINPTGESLNFPIEKAKLTLDVNLLGSLIAAQVTVRIIRDQGHSLSASLVFIASMSGYVVNKGLGTAAYSASKAGVQQLARNLASEWARYSIRVNSISPGVIRTPMSGDVFREQTDLEELWTSEAMLKRLSIPEDYHGPTVFLLSDASSYITAADLLVDGGSTSW